jgi:hypothetical protein
MYIKCWESMSSGGISPFDYEDRVSHAYIPGIGTPVQVSKASVRASHNMVVSALMALCLDGFPPRGRGDNQDKKQ